VADTLALLRATEDLLFGGMSVDTSELLDHYNSCAEISDELEDAILMRYKLINSHLKPMYITTKQHCYHKQVCIKNAVKDYGELLPKSLTEIEMVDLETCVDVFSELRHLTEEFSSILLWLSIYKVHEETKESNKKPKAGRTITIAPVIDLFNKKKKE